MIHQTSIFITFKLICFKQNLNFNHPNLAPSKIFDLLAVFFLTCAGHIAKEKRDAFGLYDCQFIFLSLRLEVNKMSELENKVRAEVGKVEDPETGQSFAEMQMIQSVKETVPGEVTVEFVPTSPFCPIAFKLAADIKAAAKTVPGVKKATVFCRGHAMEQQINEMTNKP